MIDAATPTTEPTATTEPTIWLAGRCDAAGCMQPTAYVTRGYLADGTSPTYNEACVNHGGDIAANYLLGGSLVRSDITRIDQLAHDI